MKTVYYVFLSAIWLLAVSCDIEEPVIDPSDTTTTEGDKNAAYQGFYVINQGTMGSNKATIDYFSYLDGVYTKNIFPSRNPEVIKELGDVGNDIKIYGSKMYAVINCSNIIEVMDKNTARHLATITVPNGRYLAFDGGKAYVSSYAGSVQMGNYQKGYVMEIDTTTLSVTRQVEVGYQPNEIAVSDGFLYVANSGGYTPESYDNTVSKIDLSTFAVVSEAVVADNLNRIQVDSRGNIYVSSNGDYFTTPSRIFVLSPESMQITKTYNVLVEEMVIVGDSLYAVGQNYIENGGDKYQFSIINTQEQEIATTNFIADGTNSEIVSPSGIAVNSKTGDIMVLDATTFTTSGKIHYYNKQGQRQWHAYTGIVPCEVVFLEN